MQPRNKALLKNHQHTTEIHKERRESSGEIRAGSVCFQQNRAGQVTVHGSV